MAASVDTVAATASLINFDPVDDARTVAADSSRQLQTKRNRIQLSCTHCRHAKLKCDREKPCSQCVKTGRASLCTFPAPATRKKPAVSMQNRLKHLESLVKGVMTSRAPNGPHDFASNSQIISPAAAPQLKNSPEIHGTFVEAPIYTKDGVSNPSGQVVLGPNEITYVGATHWAAMLDDVRFYMLLLN
jgi:hypothetical protein